MPYYIYGRPVRPAEQQELTKGVAELEETTDAAPSLHPPGENVDTEGEIPKEQGEKQS